LFRQRFEAEQAAKVQVSLRGQLPKAIGEVRYVSDRAMRGECEDFAVALQQNPKAFVEPFMCAPSPGIVAAAIRNEHYDSLENYLRALGAALTHEYETIARFGFLVQIDAPDLALERAMIYKDAPLK